MKESKNIPEIRFKGFEGEWEESRTIELCSISTGKSNTQDKVEDGPYPFYVRSPIIERSIKYLFDEEAVLTVGDGVGTGKVYHYVNGKYDLHQRVYRMFDFKGVFGKYFLYYFSKYFYDRVMSMTAKTSVDSVRFEMISEFPIKYPIYDEQIKISNIFQNLDKQITLEQQKHDKLVTLKKAMLEKMFPKEGARVPEIRFEGFEGEWEEKKLGDLGYTYSGLSGKTKTDFGHGHGRYITYMNVFSNPVAKKETTEAIEVDNNQNKVQFGDVFFTTSSETPEEVGMSSVWLADCQDTYLNSFCFGYRPVIKVDNYYFAYLLRSNVIRKEIIFLAQGISRYNISKNKVMEISVPLPTIEEQSQIGSYFQNLDKLISLQQQKIDKLKNIKKACLEKMFV